jgi:hypothetical protein
MTKAEYLPKLSAYLHGAGLARVHADATEQTARAAFAALAGLPHFDQLWAGDLRESVQIVAVASGERVAAVEFAHRAQELHERALAMGDKVIGNVQVLQLAFYDRPMLAEERNFVLWNARVSSWWPFARGSVATWVGVLAEPQIYATRFRGWPQELSADQLRALFS